MEILVTGFEPFGGESVNPSWEAVRLLPGEIGGARVRRLCLPVAGERALGMIRTALCEHPADLVVSVGQAGGRYGVTPERVALNLDDYRIPDNDGLQPVDVPIEPEGAAALFSTLPVKAMVQAIREAGYPSSLSDSAGTYVCNHVMYGVLSFLARKYPGAKGGFIHVPYSTAQAAQKQNVPGMSLTDMAGSLQAALLAAVCSLNFPFVS